MLNRRDLCRTGLGLLAAGAAAEQFALAANRSAAVKFTMDLCPGRIGVSADQRRAVNFAAKYGFSSVEPLGGDLMRLSNDGVAELQAELEEKGLVWGAGGFPVDVRARDSQFAEALAALPNYAAAMQRAGVTRLGTWIPPASGDLPYRANFQRYVERIGAAAEILAQHELRLGLEYIGPKTLWSSGRFPFIHTMVEAQELIGEIAAPNVGLVLDSWHWYTAGETVDDLLALSNDEIVAVDLNDAPDGVPVDEQIDSRRRLPLKTGVIDLQGFLDALVAIGYDGPVRAEPFSQELNAMDDEPAVAATAEAMKQAFALVGA